MKKSELIAKLNAIEGDPEVCIFDWRKNINRDWGEPNSHGVENEFQVKLNDYSELPEGSKPWIELAFDNDDYNDSGDIELELPKKECCKKECGLPFSITGPR